MIDPWILAFSAVTVIVTIWMGFRSAKTSKTASDFFVAGRSVSVGWNASAISGEYLSAASFMGVAGMVMSSGYDALWYPACYACGYLFLLLFIAGPLRRFGAYTIPDFAEGRYDSPVFRKIAVVFVLFIGFFYTMPQMKGAGTTLAYIFPGLPYWAGVVVVGAVITLNVALGGMKGITLVQAFQYWAKMFAISVPIFVLMAVYGHYGKQLEVNGTQRKQIPEGLSPAGMMELLNSPPGTNLFEFHKPGSGYSPAPMWQLQAYSMLGKTLSRKLGINPRMEAVGISGKSFSGQTLELHNLVKQYGMVSGKQTVAAATTQKLRQSIPWPERSAFGASALRLYSRLLEENGIIILEETTNTVTFAETTILVRTEKKLLEAAPGNSTWHHGKQLGLNRLTETRWVIPVDAQRKRVWTSIATTNTVERWTGRIVRIVGTQRAAKVGVIKSGISGAEFTGPETDVKGLMGVYGQLLDKDVDAIATAEMLARPVLFTTNRVEGFAGAKLASEILKTNGFIVVEESASTVVFASTNMLQRTAASTTPPSEKAAAAFTRSSSTDQLSFQPQLPFTSGEELRAFLNAKMASGETKLMSLRAVSAGFELPLTEAVQSSVGIENTLRNQIGLKLSRFGTNQPTIRQLRDAYALGTRKPIYYIASSNDTRQIAFDETPFITAKSLTAGIEETLRTNGMYISPLNSSQIVMLEPEQLGMVLALTMPSTNNHVHTDNTDSLMSQRQWDFSDLARKPLPEKAPADSTWLSPFGPLTTKAAKAAKLSAEESKPYSLLYTYSLIIALVCGTAGLPHILVRFYTNPDGVAAKRTTMWVMILIGIFYVFPPVFGVIGRNLLPELYSGIGAKGTDKIVLELPRLLNEKYAPLGSILSGITCAGAFAAFMSTFSGLLVSMTGALAHDVYGRMLRPKSTPEQRMRMFRVGAVALGLGAIIAGSFVEPLQINFMVGQAFAIAAASYFPLLFMSAWWRGMTMKGAAIGMLSGGTLALTGISLTSFSDLKWLPLDSFWATHPLLRILCEQPAIWAVPLAITLMVVVSKLTRREVPSDIRMKMLVLHAPEKLGLKQEYIQEHQTAH